MANESKPLAWVKQSTLQWMMGAGAIWTGELWAPLYPHQTSRFAVPLYAHPAPDTDEVEARKAAAEPLPYLGPTEVDDELADKGRPPPEGAPQFQQRMDEWLLACFGEEIARDKAERNHRFLEESLELVQALGCTASEAHQLVDYVFGRPAGDAFQEVGGAVTTLAALCVANSFDMNAAAEAELARIWTKVDVIRAKQAAKPKHSPLPAAPPEGAPVAQPVATVREFGDVHYRGIVAAVRNVELDAVRAREPGAPVAQALRELPPLTDAEVKHIIRATPGPEGYRAALVRAGFDAGARAVLSHQPVGSVTVASSDCPICGRDTPHGHTPDDLVGWLRAQVGRFLPDWQKVMVIRTGDDAAKDAAEKDEQTRHWLASLDFRDAARAYDDMVREGSITRDEAARRLYKTFQEHATKPMPAADSPGAPKNENDIEGQGNRQSVTVIVQGHPTPMTLGVSEPLSNLVASALATSRNAGPRERWELYDADGNVLNLTLSGAESGIASGAELFLSLRAGVAGNAAACAKDRDPKGGDPYSGLRSEGLEPDPVGGAPKTEVQGNRQSGSGT